MIYGWSIVVLQIVFSGPEAEEDIADVAIERASILWSNALIVRVRLDVFTKRVPTLFLKSLEIFSTGKIHRFDRRFFPGAVFDHLIALL